MPSIGTLFGLTDTVVMVMFIAVGLCKMCGNDPSNDFISNGIEEKCGFDNDHLEISMVHIMDQRSYYVKLGYCNENPCTIWRKHKKGIMT